jgi:8-hydroxy-5-deazaflavin:NADPH oxidoreductase
MNVGVLGTGMVGRTLAWGLSEIGHDSMIGTRDPAALAARTDGDAMGNQPFPEWHAEHPSVAVGTFAESSAHGAMIFNATSGAASLDALRLAGEANFDGKVIVDVSNPLDFSKGFPPSLLVANTDSLAEQIQRAFPRARVVKSLNTMSAPLMVDPTALADGDHVVFVSGNDDAAKAEVSTLLRDGWGWKHVLDLGDLSSARAAEMYLPLWLRLMGALETPTFNISLVRSR